LVHGESRAADLEGEQGIERRTEEFRPHGEHGLPIGTAERSLAPSRCDPELGARDRGSEAVDETNSNRRLRGRCGLDLRPYEVGLRLLR
jgi:hypothetical protein